MAIACNIQSKLTTQRITNNLITDDMKEFTDATFAGILAEGKPVIVDFGAVWCGPCQAIAPIVDELAEEFSGKITVGKMDVDENDTVPSDLGVTNIPCLVFFKNGQEVRRHVGFCQKAELRKMFAELVGETVADEPKEEKKSFFSKLFGK